MRIVLPLVALLATASPAAALTIRSAGIAHGAIEVRGKEAPPSAAITWQGRVVGTARPTGSFAFRTTDLPHDCVGTVGDGTNSARAVLAGCAPSTRGLVVIDATGRMVGPYVVDPGGDLVFDAVALPTEEGPALVSFTAESFAAYSSFDLLYESGDCSGTPWAFTTPTPLTIVRAFGYDDGHAYFGPRIGGRTTLMSFERLGVSSDKCTAPATVFTAPNRCCYTSAIFRPLAANAAPAGTIDVTRFVPPLRVEVR